jgi:hypothetical protein
MVALQDTWWFSNRCGYLNEVWWFSRKCGGSQGSMVALKEGVVALRCGGSQGGVVALKEVWLSMSDVGFSGGTNVVALKEVKCTVKAVILKNNIDSQIALLKVH